VSQTRLVFAAVVPFGFRLSARELQEQIQEAVWEEFDRTYRTVVNVEQSYT
jgi:hypothetical protein